MIKKRWFNKNNKNKNKSGLIKINKIKIIK